MSRLYIGVDQDNAMHMVWHDDEFVKGDMGKMNGNINPVLMGDSPHRRHLHFAIHHLAEERFAVMRTDGDEISASGRIVPAAQAGAFNPIFLPKQGHLLAHAFSLSGVKRPVAPAHSESILGGGIQIRYIQFTGDQPWQ